MRTPTPTMDVRADTPEELPASPKPPDVGTDVGTDVGRDVGTRADVAAKASRRRKRRAETATPPPGGPTKRPSAVDVGVGRALRVQELGRQRHLMDAVRRGDAGELRRLLEERHGKFDVNFFDADGQTALHHSCVDGNVELVKLLVNFGADTTLANRDGWNPLHIATFSGHRDIVLYLIGGAR